LGGAPFCETGIPQVGRDAAQPLLQALKRHGEPEAITTDGLRSYRAAMNELGNAQKQEIGR